MVERIKCLKCEYGRCAYRMSKNECAVPKEIVDYIPKIIRNEGLTKEKKEPRTIFTFD